jgi:topoisomerase-4 subunit A
VNPNGEAERVNINLKPALRMRTHKMEYDFATLAIKSRTSKGNTLSSRIITSVTKRTEGVSTLSARKIWFDSAIKRLNADGNGMYLGEFSKDDKILTFYSSGAYRITGYDLSLHFDDDLILIEKLKKNKPLSVFYIEKETDSLYLKRFVPELSNKKIDVFEEQEGAKLVNISYDWLPIVKVGEKELEVEKLDDIKKYKAKGKRIEKDSNVKVEFLEPLEYIEEEEIEQEQEEIEEYNSELNEGETMQGSLF